MATTRRVPNDPGRRDRILDAALTVIAARGVAGTSHRRIAAQAEVPLGSLTYYFDSLDDLLHQAFDRLSRSMTVDYEQALSRATSLDEAEAAVVELICGPTYADERQLTLIFELYAYGNQHPRTGEVAGQWLHRSRESLMLHFSEPVARTLDGLIEAWPMHQRFEGRPLDRELVARMVHAVVLAGPPADG